VADAIQTLGIRHAVITSVTRDDLPDGGASHFAATIQAIRKIDPAVTIEVLTPDFSGCETSVQVIIAAEPDVFGHNIETVARLYPILRGQTCSYQRGLDVLRLASQLSQKTVVKSAIMVGHGETIQELYETLSDLRNVGCEIVAIGQYLQPSKDQCPVVEYLEPSLFDSLKEYAYSLGFTYVTSGPFVRSSYRAEEALRVCQEKRSRVL